MIKRYTNDGSGEWFNSCNGSWCESNDVAELEAELADTKADRDSWMEQCMDARKEWDDMRIRYEKAMEALRDVLFLLLNYSRDEHMEDEAMNVLKGERDTQMEAGKA